jgi:hypothetical protein
MSIVILTTGCRDWTDHNAVGNALYEETLGHTDIVVFHGDCPTGADKFVGECCDAVNLYCRAFPADWEQHGKAAGPIRNREMVKAALVIRNLNHGRVVCLAFWDGESRGTWNCIQEAVRAGLPVRIIPKRQLPQLPT